ncbi:MAG: replication-relaxation family protein [Planctomycetes bacterium]|nr:replication-relaxation family protein [Planctomycetota bacterium]
MTRPPKLRLLTTRDLEILAALDCCPLTALQLLKLSRIFGRPFTGERRVRERLQILCDGGRVRRSQYATADRGALNYYTLLPAGYHVLHGPDAKPPTKRYFGPIGFAREPHTRALADFVVHTAVAAHDAGVRFTGFYRENAFWLPVGGEMLYPDCAFQRIAFDREFSFFVELDNSGQRMRSSSEDAESWQRKIRLYEAFRDLCPLRFRVLVVTTRSTERLGHILELAASSARNPQRSLFYGTTLSRFLNETCAVTAPCFTDHRCRLVSLVPRLRAAETLTPVSVAPPLAVTANRSRPELAVC